MSWSKTLAVLALSSGEAELMSLVKAGTEALGLQALYRDFGEEMSIPIASDATAAIGMVSRLGLGKVRHLAVSDLWLQEKARNGTMQFCKVAGSANPADAFTKAHDLETLRKHMREIGMVKLGGRAEIAPQAKVNDK